MTKIVLGTAQFGMDYGINNVRGAIPRNEVFDILKMAMQSGIDVVDTAQAYGESENIIGDFIRSNHSDINVISKLPACGHEEVRKIVTVSMERLCLTSIFGYLLHDFSSYRKNSKVWYELEKLKKEKKIRKIGFSLYLPSELDVLLKSDLEIDIVQVPFNVFDQRFSEYFAELRKRSVEVYARSVFLQGIVFKDYRTLGSHFDPIKDKIKMLSFLSKKSGIPIVALCINFALINDCIDRVVVGVNNLQNMREIIIAPRYGSAVRTMMSELLSLREDQEKVLLPFRWNISSEDMSKQ